VAKIYTKTGDKGKTSLLEGTRVPKYHVRIEAYGTVDELNASMGMLGEEQVLQSFIPLIREVQNKLFTLGSILANDPEKSHFEIPGIEEADIKSLEDSIDQLNDQLDPLKNFVLPGGHPANAWAHICRTVCRRAERRVVELAEQTELDPKVIRYLNRLSDWLFMVARFASKQSGAEEIIWK
jgi:cob(I)alamin adenosyltransferase